MFQVVATFTDEATVSYELVSSREWFKQLKQKHTLGSCPTTKQNNRLATIYVRTYKKCTLSRYFAVIWTSNMYDYAWF
mgnify:CR=1 FL=1